MGRSIVIVAFIAGSICSSCSSTSTTDAQKVLDFGSFTIEVPSSWDKVKMRGIDSYVGQIAIDDTDTLSFDLGWYSSSLTEEPPFRLHETDKGTEVHLKNEAASTRNSSVYEYVGMTTDVNIYRFMKDTALYETIDNRKAKIVRPKNAGEGTTGVYFDSLWVAGSGIDRFQLNGRDLKPENERLVLQAIKTLRFNDR